MVFKVKGTFDNPTQGANRQRGYPEAGAGAQTIGPYEAPPERVPVSPMQPIKGLFSWLFPTRNADVQRGYPSPDEANQRRPRGSMPNEPIAFGGVYQNETPYYDRGAAGFVPNFGKVTTNPIGAGIYAPYRPQPSYGSSGQYADGAIWWTSQMIPTTVNLQGLTTPEELAGLLDGLEIQAVVRTTG